MLAKTLRCRLGTWFAVLLLATAATPARGLDGAEVELYGYAISQAGAPPNYGFPANAPDLVRDDDSEVLLGPHDDHDDVAFTRDRLYGNGERVNTSRSFGGNGPARGTIDAGHSISVTSGWADAGSNELGARAETNAGSQGPSAGGAATSSARLEKRISILSGDSGLVDGDVVAGLRWVLDGHGSLEVGGRSFPHHSAASAAADIHLLMLRGPTGRCGAFDCPHGALAVLADFTRVLAATDLEPEGPGDPTAHVIRHDTWTASNNTGAFKAGGVFDSGTTELEVASVNQEDVVVGRSASFDTGAAPLGLDEIEFDANVGETLKVEMDLDAYASLAGWGHADADFFGSFSGHIEDPQARGLVFASSVPVPEPDAGTAGGVATMLLGLWRARARQRPSMLDPPHARSSSRT